MGEHERDSQDRRDNDVTYDRQAQGGDGRSGSGGGDGGGGGAGASLTPTYHERQFLQMCAMVCESLLPNSGLFHYLKK